MLGRSGAPGGSARGSAGSRPAAVRSGRGCAAGPLSDRSSGPAVSVPLLPVLGAAAFPSPPSTGPPRGRPGSLCPEHATTGRETLPLSPSPETASWGRCLVIRPVVDVAGTVTAYWLRHLPVSVPALSECWLPPWPASHMFLDGPGGACTTGSTPRDPRTFSGFLGQCHRSPPCQNFFYNPIRLLQALCPCSWALSHDPFYL